MPRQLIVLAVAVCLTAAACSSGGGGDGDDAGSGFAAGLARLPGAATTQDVEYTDMARLRTDGLVDLSAGSGQRVALGWDLVASLGTSESLYREASSIRDAVGVDVFGIDSAMAIGAGTRSAAYDFTGRFDAAAIAGKLTRLGARPHEFGSVAGLSAPPHVIAHKLVTQGIFVGEGLDQVIVTGSEFASSASAAMLPGRPDAGQSLRDADGYAEIADCLGDVVGAVVHTPTQPDNSTLVGVGVTDPGSATGSRHEVLCSVPAPGRTDAVRAAFARAFAESATDPVTGEPISASVASAEVSTTRGAVRADLAVQGPIIGYLIIGLSRNTAAYWDGSCPAARATEGRC